jgi:hypothetical protein
MTTQEALANLGLPYNRAVALAAARSFRNYYTDIARRIEAGEEIWVDTNGECETTPARQAREAKVLAFLTRAPQPPASTPTGSYPLRSVACPTHGPQTVLIGSHEQRGTVYADGSFDTRWHEQAGCGCHFDVHYFHVHADFPVADSVTIVHNPS